MSPAPGISLTMAPGGLTPYQILLAAPNAKNFWDSSQGITTSGSDVTAWVDRIEGGVGGTMLPGIASPTYTGAAPKGQTGVRGNIAAQAAMTCSPAFVPFAANTSPYSWLICRQRGTASSTRADWSVFLTGFASHGPGGTQLSRTYRAQTSGGGSATTNASAATEANAALVITGTFTGTAYNVWVNGVQRITSSANTRTLGNVAGSVTLFSDELLNYSDSTIWGLILASGNWTTGERQTLESAATAYWL